MKTDTLPTQAELYQRVEAMWQHSITAEAKFFSELLEARIVDPARREAIVREMAIMILRD